MTTKKVLAALSLAGTLALLPGVAHAIPLEETGNFILDHLTPAIAIFAIIIITGIGAFIAASGRFEIPRLLALVFGLLLAGGAATWAGMLMVG